MHEQKNVGTAEMKAFGQEILDLGARCLSAGREWLNNRRNEMENEQRGDRDRNQSRYRDDRNGRLQQSQGSRYRGTDYDDPRADYEQAQGNARGGQWERGDIHTEQRYGSDYSESGGARGYGRDDEYEQGRGQGRPRQQYDQRADRRDSQGYYGGYPEDGASIHGQNPRDQDHWGSREFPQDRYGRGSHGQGNYPLGGYEGAQRGLGRGERLDQGNHGQQSGRYGREQGQHGQRGNQSGFGQSAYGRGFYGEDDHGQGNEPGYGQGAYGHGAYGQSGMQGRQSQRGKGPRNYSRSDERITEDLNEQLSQDDEIDATDINVSVSNGEVTLEGTVEQRWIKHRIEDLAERCSGVKEVENRIRVKRADDGGSGKSASSSQGGKSSTATKGSQSTGPNRTNA